MSSVPNITYPDANSLYEDPWYTYNVDDYVNITLSGTFPSDVTTPLCQICWGDDIGSKWDLYCARAYNVSYEAFLIWQIVPYTNKSTICQFTIPLFYPTQESGVTQEILDSKSAGIGKSGFFINNGSSVGSTPTTWTLLQTAPTSTLSQLTSSTQTQSGGISTNTASTSKNSHQSLSEAAKVGIGVGLTLAFLVASGLIGFFWWRKKMQRQRSTPRDGPREIPDTTTTAVGYEKPELEDTQVKAETPKSELYGTQKPEVELDGTQLSTTNAAKYSLRRKPVGSSPGVYELGGGSQK